MKKRVKNSKANLAFEWKTASHMVISITGILDVTSISSLWDQAINLQRRHKPQRLTLELKNLSYCDSLGATLILELKRRQLETNKEFYIQNPNTEVKKLLTFLEQQKAPKIPLRIARLNFVEKLGKQVVNLLIDARENITFLGALVYYLFQTLFQPQSIRWRDFWRAMEDVGPRALPIIVLIGFLVGLITTFQSSAPLGRFGAQIYIIDLVGLGLVREMGPLMTAVLLAGRTASSFAAEIGTMKINQELDALTTMGLDAVKFLTIPRILAAIIMTPLLSMFLIVSGLIGCFLVMLTLGYNFHIFIFQLYNTITMEDFMSGLVKTFVFGAVIASTGCLYGIKTKLGATAVGDSTTKAVVSSLIMLVIVDGIFATIFYMFGI